MHSSWNIIHRCASALRLLWLHDAAPPTAVGGAHNSPIANATMILERGLVNYRLHLYNQSGVFYFPWHRHQVEGNYHFKAISGKVFCSGTQAHVTDPLGSKRTTLGSSVRLATTTSRRSILAAIGDIARPIAMLANMLTMVLQCVTACVKYFNSLKCRCCVRLHRCSSCANSHLCPRRLV